MYDFLIDPWPDNHILSDGEEALLAKYKPFDADTVMGYPNTKAFFLNKWLNELGYKSCIAKYGNIPPLAKYLILTYYYDIPEYTKDFYDQHLKIPTFVIKESKYIYPRDNKTCYNWCINRGGNHFSHIEENYLDNPEIITLPVVGVAACPDRFKPSKDKNILLIEGGCPNRRDGRYARVDIDLYVEVLCELKRQLNTFKIVIIGTLLKNIEDKFKILKSYGYNYELLEESLSQLDYAALLGQTNIYLAGLESMGMPLIEAQLSGVYIIEPYNIRMDGSEITYLNRYSPMKMSPFHGTYYIDPDCKFSYREFRKNRLICSFLDAFNIGDKYVNEIRNFAIETFNPHVYTNNIIKECHEY